MQTLDPLFNGVHFFSGMEILPLDIYADLAKIRLWAQEKGYVQEPSQFLISNRMDNISKVASQEDDLLIALVIHHAHGKTIYFEYPYIPVHSLIAHRYDITLLYWRLIPSFSGVGVDISPFREVNFGFTIPGCQEEFCSSSTSPLIVEKFYYMFLSLSDRYQVETFPDGSSEIVVHGDVSAFFTEMGQDDDITFIAT